MRVICLLFALLFGYLACYPCSDGSCTSDANSETEIAVHHEHSNDETDMCSPFCVCNCCRSGQINQPGYFSFESQRPVHETKHSQYLNDIAPAVSFSIWQPPRIS